MIKKRFSWGFLCTLLLIFSEACFGAQKLQSVQGDDSLFNIVKIADELQHPWGMVFLPDGNILITERPGRLRIIKNGILHPTPIAGLPKITARGQGGLLDIALHPDYKSNKLIYFSYVAGHRNDIGTEVARAHFDGQRLHNLQVIFRLAPKTSTTRHFGGRLLFDRDNFLYITLGDRGDRPRAQDLNDHAGAIIRLHDDGTVPVDNPFISQDKHQSQIYSFGHRNPQGMALNPQTNEVWIHEHGPQGGDEINIIHKGQNYGWPVITYGVNYVTGTKIGEGTHNKGMLQPLYYWVPSIAPSGMAFYSGDQFPDWNGDLFIGSLKFQLLVHLQLQDGKVVREERFFTGKLGRIRDVRTGPDGYLYLLTDAGNGSLIRLEPRKSL